jgi:hypothetical protein
MHAISSLQNDIELKDIDTVKNFLAELIGTHPALQYFVGILAYADITRSFERH